ncbi:hypothetical protein [Achromobacter sp.]|uniref:hypothetical protein n=1 Tax=Achromobacter sp. TaxID=134375 RepID=UPI0028A9B881|nr:hypothetical protein [Achromobacter sp.]
MEQEWKVVARGTSEGWSYTVEVQECDGGLVTRITPGNQSFRLLDGTFTTLDQALSAAKVVAEEAIRGLRKAEGYRPE